MCHIMKRKKVPQRSGRTRKWLPQWTHGRPHPVFHCQCLRPDADLSHLCTRHSGSCWGCYEQTGGEFTQRQPIVRMCVCVRVCGRRELKRHENICKKNKNELLFGLWLYTTWKPYIMTSLSNYLMRLFMCFLFSVSGSVTFSWGQAADIHHCVPWRWCICGCQQWLWGQRHTFKFLWCSQCSSLWGRLLKPRVWCKSWIIHARHAPVN